MAELLDEPPKCVLAIYAHPDDADLGCAGTIAKWVSQGTEAHLVVCTDGGKGTHDATLCVSDLAKRRSLELKASSEIVGFSSVRCLGTEDGAMTEGLRQDFVSIIRKHKPNVVFSHDPTAVFFGQDYFNHRDHRTCGYSVLDAIAPAAALPHYFPNVGLPHRVSLVLLSGTLDPQVYVDITGSVEKKVHAVECHKSQFATSEIWAADAVRRRAQEDGRRCGVGFAESFRSLRNPG